MFGWTQRTLRKRNLMLETRRAAYLAHFGEVRPEVVSRERPESGVAWPASVLGRMRIVQRRSGRLLVTDGLSSLYDTEIHSKLPPAPLDYELAVDVLDLDPRATSDEALATSWYPNLLYSLTDWAVSEHFDLLGILAKFRAITVSVLPTSDEMERLAGKNGRVGVLIGMSLLGGEIDRQAYLHNYYEGTDPRFGNASMCFLPVKPLTPDEYQWAHRAGNEGAVQLAEKFLARKDRHFHWTDRPSVLVEPSLR